MGHVPPNKKVERNREVYNDWKNGVLMIDMVAKYRISSVRLYKIIEQEKLAIYNSKKTE